MKRTQSTQINRFSIRRVVAGHDERGKAMIVSDGVATNVLRRPDRPGVTLTNLWQTFETSVAYDGPEESVDGPLVLQTQTVPPLPWTSYRCCHA